MGAAGNNLLIMLLAAALLTPSAGLQASRARVSARGPLANDWFETFAEGESTNPGSGFGLQAQGGPDGFEYEPEAPNAAPPSGRSAAWYQESPSGSEREAWQTYFPAHQSTGGFGMTPGGHFTEEYQHVARHGPSAIVAGWFDASVENVDKYGRNRLPDWDSPAYNTLFWKERAVNTTLNCDTVGCTAESLMQAFSPSQEEVRYCKLSVFLHPTDFDDLYSGERLTHIKVNDVLVNTDCFPMISGCNASSQAPLYPCLQDLPLDDLLNTTTGVLHISAQISNTVDECPYQGHLLAAVPMVTCLVAPRVAPTVVPEGPKVQQPVPELQSGFAPVVATAPLRCMERGCAAHASIVPDPLVAESFWGLPIQCKLDAVLYQTDYDNEDGTPELLEYLNVNGSTVLSDLAPGGNPCRSLWAGTPLPADKKSITLFRDQEVTALFLEGGLSVDAKITKFVDECAHNGYLLDGLIELRCALNYSAPVLVAPAPAPVKLSPVPSPRRPVLEPLRTPTPAPPRPLLPLRDLITTTPTLSAEPMQASAASPAPAPLSAPTMTPALGRDLVTDDVMQAGGSPTTTPVSPTPPPTLTPSAPLTRGAQIAPFGHPDTARMLEEYTERSQDMLVDAVESAQVSEIKRAIFRALTRLRAAQIKEYDTIARIELQGMDDFNDDHNYRKENPLLYVSNSEPAVSVDKYWSFHEAPHR